MTPEEISDARHELGLSQREMADMLDTDKQTVRRMEMDPSAQTAREPAPRMVRLIKAYIAGYRPDDWPEWEDT
jgi:DNA-binding transcriptional regulator YiaG